MIPFNSKKCEHCGKILARKTYGSVGQKETPKQYLKRRFCNSKCKGASEYGDDGPTDVTLGNHARKFLADKCESCGTKKSLQAHHVDKDRSNNVPENIRTFCQSCHIKYHWENDNWRDAFVIDRGRKPYPKGPCKVAGCNGISKTVGLCKKHYTRFKRHGDPTVVKKRGPAKSLKRKES